MHIAFFGSSLLSSYWNGASTYYRGIIAALARRGYRVTFYEPDAFDRQRHRDIDPPEWAEVVVYEPTMGAMQAAFRHAAAADAFVKASGVGVLDNEILAATVAEADKGKIGIFWDVDAPATLAEIDADPSLPLRSALKRLDCVFTYGGGLPVIEAYRRVSARRCVPIYNALDPETHFPVNSEARFAADLAFLGNRLPDREARVDAFFFEAARLLPDRKFLLAGSGWEPWQLPQNVRFIGHLPTRDHNAFNCSPLAVINISRNSMAATGFSPATRVFEAAGAGACLMTDGWEGIAEFLSPDEEVIVVNDGHDVARALAALTTERARQIGERARSRVLGEHTYDQRAEIVARVLGELATAKDRQAVA
jgi:spore maturation protein CgeB